MTIAPPPAVASPLAWARRNLFEPWYNAALTVVFGALLAVAFFRAFRFVFSSGRWEIIRVNVTSLLVGTFPRAELWRVWIAVFAVTAAAGLVVGASVPVRETPDIVGAARGIMRRSWPLLLLVATFLVLNPSLVGVAAFVAVCASAALAWSIGRVLGSRRARLAWAVAAVVVGIGFWLMLGGVGWDRWGGLVLTLFLATAGIVASFPIGVLLALGRRSSLPAVRVVCVGYIELIRGVPLITLLFMGSFVIGFLFPPGVPRPSLVTRALLAIIAFTAAYIAEIVRGGLQSIPRGQIEAALAVGLSPIAAIRLIVLPQALRAVIPAIVGQFISLFKDTSLVAIIGLTDLLRVAQSLGNQPRFLAQGLQAETLVFASLIYWVGAYTMSKESQRLERRLGAGTR